MKIEQRKNKRKYIQKLHSDMPYADWIVSNGEIYEKQLKAWVAIKNRFFERKIMLEKQEAGPSPRVLTPLSQASVEQHYNLCVHDYSLE